MAKPKVAIGELGVIENQSRIEYTEGLWHFGDDDWALMALLQDPVYMSELLFVDPKNQEYAGCYHVHDYQYNLFRWTHNYEGKPCARSVGKTESIKAQAVCHVFRRQGEDMLISAPELIHLLPLTDQIEARLSDTRLTREYLDQRLQKTGFTHKPFQASFIDGTKIIGRIPKISGTGVKGMHEPDLRIDEGQDYPEKGWIEVHETVMKDHVDKWGEPDFTYHFYGVHSGARDGRFYRLSTSGEFKITAITALMRPGWGPDEKKRAAAIYGGTQAPDYRRNILGEAGGSANAFFVTSRLMACFTADTLVSTNNGRKRIAEIVPGELVLNAAGLGPVEAVHRIERDRVVRLVLDDGEEIVCSPEHPILTEHGWAHAEHLPPGERLIDHAEAVRSLWTTTEDETNALLLADLRREVVRDHPWAGWSHDAHLRGVWDDLHALGGGSLLRAGVHGGARGPLAVASREGVCGLRPDVQARENDDCFVQSSVSREADRGDERCQARPEDRLVSLRYDDRRPTRLAACVARQAGRGVVSTVLDSDLRHAGGSSGPVPGHRQSHADGGGRGGWQQPSPDARGRRPTRQVAQGRRVARVEILERGSQHWDRLCGGGDTVELYDLTVGGHPSFCVGRSAVVVHNCLDQDRESKYNTVEWKRQSLMAEEVDKMLGDYPVKAERDAAMAELLRSLIDLPDLGQQVYFGMDVGLINDPTVITLWTIHADKGKSRLRLVRMIHLWRFREKQIRQVLYLIGFKYGNRLRGGGIDVTGLGLPMFQAMEDDEVAPQLLLDNTRGYVFNAKVPIGIDKSLVTKDSSGTLRDHYGNIVEEETDPFTNITRYVVRMTMIEASTRYLREFIDTGFMELPFDPEIVGDMQGETEQRVKAMAGMRKKPNAFHILDSMRAFAMAYKSADIEEQMKVTEQTPVLARAVDAHQPTFAR